MNFFLGVKAVSILIFMIFFAATFSMITQSYEVNCIDLSEPVIIEKSIDEIIQKRTSIREFTDTPVSDEELSTILWNAFGTRTDGSHTIPQMKDEYAIIIYVLMQDGIYRYDPLNHSLSFYKKGDVRSIGQYDAPIQLGICWDTCKNNDENIVGMQIGAVGQNIYHTCLGLGLGTVATAEIPCPLDSIGLPQHHKGRIVMPVGNPTVQAKYVKIPMWLSFLPRVRDAGVSLSETLAEWNTTIDFSHQILSRQQVSQFLWACYGYSYYLDHSGFQRHYIERHRTVPSAHGYYPLEVFLIDESGVYRYIPGLTNNDPVGFPIISFLWKVKNGDIRDNLGEITDQVIKKAPVSLLLTLNIPDTIQWDDLSDQSLRWVWTYEVGACIQNVVLDTTAWDFTCNIVPIEQDQEVNALLGLNADFDSFAFVSIG